MDLIPGSMSLSAVEAELRLEMGRVNPRRLAMKGLQDFLKTVKKINSRVNEKLEASGILHEVIQISSVFLDI